jgi:hypothetical protein
MSESRLEIDNQEYQTYLSELGKGWVGLGSVGSRVRRISRVRRVGFGSVPGLAASADEVLLNVLGARKIGIKVIFSVSS